MRRLLRCIGFICLILNGLSVQAQTATLSAPAQAPIASSIEVAWTGPGYTYDRIFAAAPNAPDSDGGAARATVIRNNTGAVQVLLPDTPGRYELRYFSAQNKTVLARASIDVVDVPASLSAASEATVGAQLEVTWSGPGTRYDLIAVYGDTAGDDAKPLASASITGRKNPLPVTLPETPGSYQLRYLTAQSKRVLARHAITVNDVPASISAPANAKPGEDIQIGWSGPGNKYDRIELHPAGAPQDAKPVASKGLLGKSPISHRLPEVPGSYELRYELNRSGRVLAAQAITIGAVDTALSAPERATAATMISVGWQGPGNNYDQIGVFETDAADDAKPLAVAAILNGRNPVPLKLPETPGSYELRYRTAQSKAVLARKPLLVQAAGRLAVVFERQSTLQGTGGGAAIELILDASGSMLKRDADGVRRIDHARQVLSELVSEYLPEGATFALRVFGHKQADSCRTDLEIPAGPLNRQQAGAAINAVNAMNLAKTPIADSLAKVPQDLASASGPKTVILITDGEETCDGDPEHTIAELRAAGLDIQLSVVGFAIDDPALKSSFETWAELGGGSYFDARSASELSRSLRRVISGPFRVLDGDGTVVGSGIIGGASIVLPVGKYRVETAGAEPLVLNAVTVSEDELTTAAF